MENAKAERCAECGAQLTNDVCGTCRPTGRPADKGLRRLEADAAEHEKEQWDRHLVERKSHPRPRSRQGYGCQRVIGGGRWAH